MAELAALLQTEIPEGRNHLIDSHTNLERVAEYCEANYFQSENKRLALESTKNYTTQSLASVAYQINTLAYNFLQLLELQTMQLAEMEGQMNHIAQTVAIHKEKVARREIGVLTANKVTNRQYKIIAPANPEKPIKYVRKSIDYAVSPSQSSLAPVVPARPSDRDPQYNLARNDSRRRLSDSDRGIRDIFDIFKMMMIPILRTPREMKLKDSGMQGLGEQIVVFVRQCIRAQPRSQGRGGRTAYARQINEANGWSYKPIEHLSENPVFQDLSLDDIGHGARWGANNSGGTPRGRRSTSSVSAVVNTGPAGVPLPAPTTKPPTPPATARAAATPSNTGTLGRGTLGKSSREYRTPPAVAPPQVPSHYAPNYPRRPGYSTLPVAAPASTTTPVSSHQPQVGMVHPNQHTPPNYTQEMHSSMPPPPSPLIGSDGENSQHSMILSGQRASSVSGGGSVRGGSVSPPLPPPPLEDDLAHDTFTRHHQRPAYAGAVPAIVPDEEDLPGWVPKNYIEKVVAIYDYYADKEDELSFQESAVIYVLKKNDDGWWEGVMDGVTGLFPGNYVEPCV
ncbi:Abl interactor 2 [Eumeta japonica]|uniref:Abl interactor 2 n=1 Tax=Eumeta variegata TaxID=151549 RepID=A0A4C1VHC9_EUMVA|nr:Abl interactor 2 [Eumeta japonica]